MVVLDFDTYTLLAQQSALLSKLMDELDDTPLASSSTVLQLIELEAKVAEVAQQNENSPAAALSSPTRGGDGGLLSQARQAAAATSGTAAAAAAGGSGRVSPTRPSVQGNRIAAALDGEKRWEKQRAESEQRWQRERASLLRRIHELERLLSVAADSLEAAAPGAAVATIAARTSTAAAVATGSWRGRRRRRRRCA